MQEIEFTEVTTDEWVQRATRFVKYTTSQGYSFGEAHQFRLEPAIPTHFVPKEGLWDQLEPHFDEKSLLYEVDGAFELHSRAMQKQIQSCLWNTKDEQVTQELLWGTISALMNISTDTDYSSEVLDKQMRQFSWFETGILPAFDDKNYSSDGFVSLDAKGSFLSIIAFWCTFD